MFKGCGGNAVAFLREIIWRTYASCFCCVLKFYPGKGVAKEPAGERGSPFASRWCTSPIACTLK